MKSIMSVYKAGSGVDNRIYNGYNDLPKDFQAKTAGRAKINGSFSVPLALFG